MSSTARTYLAYESTRLLVRGDLHTVVEAAKRRLDDHTPHRVAMFEEESGRAFDIDVRGSLDEVIARLASHPLLAGSDDVDKEKKPRGPGRPKLGVVSREISMLPRHWEWLATQRGGASAALRRLVDAAKNQDSAPAGRQRTIEAAHRFMWDIAGDQQDFEEASRALFAGDTERFRERISTWPEGIRTQLERYAERIRSFDDEE